MKRRLKKPKVNKGMPSAVLLSIVIHVALFLLAGMLVVFTVVKKEEKKFVPPKAVERPKMKLKKPKVKVKKNTKPKATTRIVTKINRASMPDIQIPELSGMGEGLGEMLGGFDMMPDLGEPTLFGTTQSIGNDFVGTYYDFTREQSGRNIPMSPEQLIGVLRKFVKSDWRPSKLGRYYRSPNKLYTTCFAIPQTLSWIGPAAFGGKVGCNYCYALHYKGKLVHPEDITFRFWGLGNECLIVRVDGEVVLNGGYPRAGGSLDTLAITHPWQTDSPDSRKYWMANTLSVVGDRITLKAGEPLDMEVLIVDLLGNKLSGVLCVEVEGEEYEREPERGGPILPLFKTEMLSLDQIENIHSGLSPHDGCATNGPVFCDFTVPERTTPYYDTSDTQPPAPPLFKKADYQDPRTWTALDGRTMEAKFTTIFAGKAVLENQKGRQLKIPLEELTPEDRLYLDLAKPPEFNINFSKKSSFIPQPELSPYGQAYLLRMSDYVFEAQLKQGSTGNYPHELLVEYFAIGEEVDGNNYVLVDRQQSTFLPSRENGKSHSFHSVKPIRLQSLSMGGSMPMRGTKYGGYLITITDQNEKIIQYKTPYGDWMFENLENLKKIPVGKHFNKHCVRVGPPRPTLEDRPQMLWNL